MTHARIRPASCQGAAGLVGILVACSPAGAAPTLQLGRVTWQETAAVQTDGVLEPGESGRLVASLWNRGDAEAPAPSGVISVLSPPTGVSVVTGVSTWPDIGGGATEAGDAAVELAIEPGVPCGTLVSLSWHVRSAGMPDADLPFTMRVGVPESVPVAPAFVDPFTTAVHVVAWNGAEYGMAWRYDSNPFSTVRFQRLDAAGTRIGAYVQIPPAFGQDGSPSLAWGGDRWAIVRSDVDGLRLALLDAGGSIVSQTYVARWDATTGIALMPTIAWDGAGFGIAFHAEPATAPPPDVRRLLGFVHVDRDGVVDAGPLTIDTGMSLTYWREPIVWNGSDQAILCWGRDGMRLIRVERSGTVASMSPIAPFIGDLPDLAWSGHGYGIAASGSVDVVFMPVGPDGTSLGEPVVASWHVDPRAGPEDRHGKPAVIASDGAGFAIASPRIGPRNPPFVPDELWVEVTRVDDCGKASSPPVRLTSAESGREYASTGRNCVWNAATGEFALGVARSTDATRVQLDEGQAHLSRVAVAARCPEGEPPPEVSGPASGSPLLVTRRVEPHPSCPTCPPILYITLHVEDPGAAADALNVYVLGTTPRGAAVDGSWLSVEYCHIVPGSDVRVVPDGPGRLAIDAHLRITGPVTWLEWYLVSASNEWGEGPKGFDSFGLPEQPVNGCLAFP